MFLKTLHNDSITEARTINRSLATLAQGGVLKDVTPCTLDAGNEGQAKCAIKFYGRIRQHAKGLYETLKVTLDTDCVQGVSQFPYDAGLRLETRDFDMSGSEKEVDPSGTGANFRFRTFLSFEDTDGEGFRTWYGMDVEPVSDVELEPRENETPRIENVPEKTAERYVITASSAAERRLPLTVWIDLSAPFPSTYQVPSRKRRRRRKKRRRRR